MRGAGGMAAEAARLAALGLGALLVLLPLLVMTLTAFKTPADIFAPGVNLLPRQWDGMANFIRVLTSTNLPLYLANGVLVCAAILVLQLLIAVPCAYALAKHRFRGRELMFTLVLAGLLIPAQVPAIPLYIAFAQLGLINTYAALVLPHVISVFGIFLFRQFFMTVPDELIDAARLDGCDEGWILWRLMVPLAVPAVVAFAIFSVVAHWNDLFWPMIAVNREELATPPLGVVFFRNAESGDEYGALMAAALLVTLPLLLAFLFAQRRFLDGLAATRLR